MKKSNSLGYYYCRCSEVHCLFVFPHFNVAQQNGVRYNDFDALLNCIDLDDDALELVDMTDDSVLTRMESDVESEEGEGQEKGERALEGDITLPHPRNCSTCCIMLLLSTPRS